MIDIKRATELIRQHFAELTPEQFIENLKQSCPEVFEDEQEEEINASFSSETESSQEKQYLTVK
jgi:hypothetical protein